MALCFPFHGLFCFHLFRIGIMKKKNTSVLIAGGNVGMVGLLGEEGPS